MNIFRKICECALVLSMLSLSACAGNNTSENTGYYDNSAYINVNVAASNVLCFDMVFFTKEKVNSVEYIGLAGEGALIRSGCPLSITRSIYTATMFTRVCTARILCSSALPISKTRTIRLTG